MAEETRMKILSFTLSWEKARDSFWSPVDGSSLVMSSSKWICEARMAKTIVLTTSAPHRKILWAARKWYMERTILVMKDMLWTSDGQRLLVVEL